jgi:hypothetical protein
LPPTLEQIARLELPFEDIGQARRRRQDAGLGLDCLDPRRHALVDELHEQVLPLLAAPGGTAEVPGAVDRRVQKAPVELEAIQAVAFIGVHAIGNQVPA